MILVQLFVSFLKVGLFSFGGGYAMLPLIEHETVDLHHWIDKASFVQIVSIAQITPGPIAINSATFVGYRVDGVVGSAVATVAVVLAPMMIVLLIARIADRFSESMAIQGALSGLKPALLALVAFSAVSIAQSALASLPAILIAAAAFAVLLLTRIHPLVVLAAAAAIGGFFL